MQLVYPIINDQIILENESPDLVKNTEAKIIINPLEIAEIQILAKCETISANTKMDEVIITLLEDGLAFSFFDFLKNSCGIKKKSTVLYNYGLENLKTIMDIDTYLKFNLEMTLIKEVLFDKNQIVIFDIISKMINLKKFFEPIIEKQLSFDRYDKFEFEEFFSSIDVLFDRQNETDRKIINFITTKIEEK